MIEAQESVAVGVGIEHVWHYVSDIRKWANLFPGCKECHVIDEHNSKWLIKVGAGGMVKTVNVLVNVEHWDGPDRVNFSYRLESEPVIGSGRYLALRQGDDSTEISLYIKVEGSGQMAPMWEAMSRPLLPQMAKSFAGRLKDEIEEIHGGAKVPRPSVLAAFRLWARRIWRAIYRKSHREIG